MILPIGLRIDPFVEGRVDSYTVENARLVRVATNGTQTDIGPARAGHQRSFATVGADLSYPLIRPLDNGGSIILEPLAQFAVSPRAKLDPNIPNEDSTAFEFDESTLFSVNRFPGFDLIEGGSRLNLAGRATVNMDGGRRATLLVGRAYHSDVQPLFSPTSGLRNTASDWITYVSVQPLPNLVVFNRMRLDRSSWAVQRNEIGLNAGIGPVSGSFRYDYNTSGLTYIASGVAPNLIYRTRIGRVEDMSLAGSMALTRNVGIEINATRDMRTRVFPQAQIGVFYQDDCIRVDWLYHHNEIFRGLGAKVGASDGIGIRLSIVTFGDTPAFGTRRNDLR
jgi:LPS-assembly protein